MHIVVTRNKVEYSGGFLKVSSLAEADQVVGTIDVLVYNNSNESSADKIKYLGLLKDRVKRLVYICDSSKIDLAVKMIVVGSEGVYFDDEFFLSSSSELHSLINSLDEVTALVNLGGVNVFSDFVNRYLRDGSSAFNTNYLSIVKEAANTMLVEYNQKSMEIIQLSETATDIFSNVLSLLSKINEEKDNLQAKLERITNKVRESQISAGRSGNPPVLFYPKINYLNEKSIIRIKEIGDFKFLTSFMLGFRYYLETVKNLRPKLIFLEPIGDIIESRYMDFKWIKTSNVKSQSDYYNSVVFTNCPSKEVLEKLLNDSDYDTFIVVDRTVSDKDHILNCKGSVVKYAVGSPGILGRFNLTNRYCMTSLQELPGVLLTVPLYLDYPKDKASREMYYITQMASGYDKLLLDLRRR